MKKLSENKYILFIAIILIQTAVFIIWGCIKTNYHWDEYYSMVYADSMSHGGKCHYIEDTEQFSLNEWLKVSDFKGLFEIEKNENTLLRGIDGIKDILFRKTEEGILNIYSALLFPGQISVWPGIISNIVFIIIGQIFLYKLMMKLTSQNVLWSNLAVLIFGLSSGIISVVIYIRFYSLIMMIINIVLYCHYLLLTEDKVLKNIFYLLISVFFIYMGCNESELMYIWGGSVILCFSIILFVRKKYIKLGYYLGPIVTGALILKWEDIKYYFVQIFNVATEKIEIRSDGPMAIMRDNIVNLGLREGVRRVYNLADYVGSYLFGNITVFVLLAILLIVLAVTLFIGKHKNNKAEKCVMTDNKAFYLMMFLSVLIYSIFAVLVSLWSFRYYSLMFAELIMVVILGIWKLSEKTAKPKVWQYIMLCLLFIGMVLSEMPGKIENVYTEDKETLERIQASEIDDNLVWNINDRQIMMECVVWQDVDDSIYVADRDENIVFDEMPDKMLLWLDNDHDLTEEDVLYIKENGYEVNEKIGETYISIIYELSKTIR